MLEGRKVSQNSSVSSWVQQASRRRIDPNCGAAELSENLKVSGHRHRAEKFRFPDTSVKASY